MEVLFYVSALIFTFLILALQQILETPMYILLELLRLNFQLNFLFPHSPTSSISHRSSERFFLINYFLIGSGP